jgi:hypothetical protein
LNAGNPQPLLEVFTIESLAPVKVAWLGSARADYAAASERARSEVERLGIVSNPDLTRPQRAIFEPD